MSFEPLVATAVVPSLSTHARHQRPLSRSAVPRPRQSAGVPAPWLRVAPKPIDRMEARRVAVVATASPPQVPLACGAAMVLPTRLTLAVAVAAVRSVPLLLAKAAVACTVGLLCRNFLANINANFDVPVEAMLTLTARQRQRAVRTVSAAACLVCFLFIV